MNKEVYKEMCCEIYEGESWDRMINCLERKDKEIERLNKELEKYKYSADELNEIERLNNIIKEVREYIENNLYSDYGYKCTQSKKELLEILDKGE